MWVPILIVLLSLTSIGSGLAQTITITTRAKSLLLLQKTKISYSLQAAATLACDISITVSLLYNLSGHKKETTVESTSTMLDKLMIVAVNRGVLIALCATANMILFLSLPDAFWFMVGLFLSSKLYMNSALATLNSRQYIKASAYSGSSEVVVC